MQSCLGFPGQQWFFRLRVLAFSAVVAMVLAGGNSRAFASSLSVRFVTFNVDFNNTAQQIDSDISAVSPNADIIMFQEAKWVSIADSFGSGWTVYQVTDQGDAQQGSAIAIRNSIKSQVLATGLVLGVDHGSAAMLDRYIAYADVKLTNGLVIRVMALHMPPERFQYLQPTMASNLEDFVNQTPYPVVVGADWNYTVNDDPYDIQGAVGLIPKGSGIDGFYYDDSAADFVSLTKMSGLNCNSDHDPVKMVANMHVPTYIIDNNSAGFTASSNWSSGSSAADKYGPNYRFHLTQQVSDTAQWSANVTPGVYNVYAWWSQGVNRSTTAPFILPDGTVVNKNQQVNGGMWNLLGTQTLSGTAATRLSCWTTAGYVVIADGLKYAP
jgi:hypothetical protein